MNWKTPQKGKSVPRLLSMVVEGLTDASKGCEDKKTSYFSDLLIILFTGVKKGM